MKLMDTLRAVSPKKRLIIGIAAACAVLVLLGCLFLLPGGNSPTGGQVKPGDAATVTVKNRAGTPLQNVQVYIYEDKSLGELVTFAKTDAQGQMTYTATAAGNVAVLKGLAAGYKNEAYYALSGNTEILLDALATTADGALPTDVKYATGDPVMDFTFTDIDGNTYTASQVLQEKNALVLNFWYTACQPCQMEFPYLQKAYDTYKDSVQLLAVDPYNADNADAVKAFRDQNGLTMPMVDADPAWASLMNIQAYPTTVVIDRYGIITFMHVGAIIEEGVFEKIFAFYGAEEYTQKITNDVDQLNVVITEDGDVIIGDNSTTDGDGNSQTTTTTKDNSKLQTDFTGVLGTKSEPIEIGGTLQFTTEIPAGKESHFNVYRVQGTVLTIKNANIEVDYDGTTYAPKGGKVEIPVTSDDVTIPIKFVIRNVGTATEKLTVDFVYPAGTLANPHKLQMGALTTEMAAGNEQGVVYTYTAPDNGTVELMLVSVTSGVACDFALYNLNTYAYRTMGADGTSDKVSVALNKGDVLQLTVSVAPDKDNKYPAATIKSNVTFTATGAVAPKPTVPTSATFTVTVKDDAGAALSGVSLQFAVGEDVKTVKTDANGIATATMAYGECKVTVTVPAGYVADKLVYTLAVSAPEATIVLTEDNWFDEPDVPDQPDEPDAPDDPDQPDNPDNPDDPDQPDNPDNPDDPDQPDNPDNPDNPDQPDNPDNPDQPDEPDQPDTPVDPEPPVEQPVDYTVTVVDGNGALQDGITVEFYSAANELLVSAVTADGKATAQLLKDNYRVKLSGTALQYDERAAVLTATKTTLELLVAPMFDDTVSYTLYCPVADADKDAYYLTEGATYVTLTPGERNYFLYDTTRTGTFRFTTTNTRAKIGYYGGPFFVLTNDSSTDNENNAFTMSIDSVGATYVIGIDAPTNVSGVIISITRIGEPGWNIANEPWYTYEGTHKPSKFTLPAGTTLTDVDIFTQQTIVYNEQDGVYHLNSADGPVLYLRFSGSAYINLADVLANQRVGAYLYDTNGDFLKKEEYTTYLRTYYYIPNAMYDPTGVTVNMLDKSLVYPLNKDLEYVVRTFGEHHGWWNPDSPNYLFKGEDVNLESAWMFLLCYGE